jgi:hypothetical protein
MASLEFLSQSAGFDASGNPIGVTIYAGQGLAILHNQNQYLERQITASGKFQNPTPPPSTAVPGIPANTKTFSSNPTNYNYLNFSQSVSTILPSGLREDLLNYEDFNQPFVIKQGDEIRIGYNASEVDIDMKEVTYTVRDVSPNTDYENGIYGGGVSGDNTSASVFISELITTPYSFSTIPVTGSIYNYDKIIVYPPPADTIPPIPEGKIYNFTIRRRVNADDRVIVYQTPPKKSEGMRTISPSGYLIPNDFSAVQKRNVQTIINQLKAKNAFSSDEANDISNSNMQS